MNRIVTASYTTPDDNAAADPYATPDGSAAAAPAKQSRVNHKVANQCWCCKECGRSCGPDTSGSSGQENRDQDRSKEAQELSLDKEGQQSEQEKNASQVAM